MKRRKISDRKRHQLLQIYLNLGQAVAGPICVEWGVGPRYAATTACNEGFSRPLWRAGNRYKHNHTDPASTRCHKDHRWQWAVERGGLIR